MSQVVAVPETDKRTGVEVVIRLREHGLPIVEEYSDGVKTGEGVYTHETIAHAVLGSLEFQSVITPILPRGAIFYSEAGKMKRYCFLEVPPHRRRALYHKAVLEDVPFPRLVFGFELMERNKKLDITSVMVGALEDQVILNEESPVYRYPYTNVQDSFQVCWGGHKLPSIERISQLSTIPELFFNSPNSDCYYSSANNSKMSYRELVTKLKGKSFPDKYLKPTGYTLQQWIDHLIGRN
ncbi:hypothetical protein Theco_4076 (plasmid) [Thermobacillus composti KWC4]|jgi:hypothetical protein|uniref:Uncharacterized protein n=1 Tax=Thermobacillus composti (strain DSM 18247 / JCM 13945 / KWC4) TaxID=717605 RepID=L0EJV7_THECK|nr:hypothetical protein [Thermobacillus composti]AGA60076.1 hypothetical protein Theco_4076 [Thermobacillus composti KWC4]